MPALIAFKRRWRIGSDDLFFPAAVGVIVRVLWWVHLSQIFFLKCLWSKNNCCLFERLFKVKKYGVFLFGISVFVLEIFIFLYYANEESDDLLKWDSGSCLEHTWFPYCLNFPHLIVRSGWSLVLLWCTFLVPSLKNTASIILEIFLIECWTVLVEPPMTSSLIIQKHQYL